MSFPTALRIVGNQSTMLINLNQSPILFLSSLILKISDGTNLFLSGYFKRKIKLLHPLRHRSDTQWVRPSVQTAECLVQVLQLELVRYNRKGKPVIASRLGIRKGG